MEKLKSTTLNLKLGTRSGVTIIEIVVAVALLAILYYVAISVFNPVGLFAGARNTERKNHIQAILSAIRQNIAENPLGTFNCGSGAIPTSTKRMSSVSSSANYDIASCLIPAYIDALPFDPSASSSHFVSNTNYDTGYNIIRNATSGQITLIAPYAELGVSVSSTR